MFEKPLFNKIMMIIFLMVALYIPLLLIHGLIKERQQYKNDVIYDIANSSYHSQKVMGGMVVIPYTKTKTVQEEVETEAYKQHHKRYNTQPFSGLTHKNITRNVITHHKYYILPENLDIKADVKTETRKRGLYEVPLYHSSLALSGYFDMPENFDFITNQKGIIGKPFLLFGASDMRGVGSHLEVLWNNTPKKPVAGTKSVLLNNKGMHIPLEMDDLTKGKVPFAINIDISGTSKISFLPMGKSTNINMTSSWPHPSFLGSFLPKERDITDNGFEAYWDISYFANDVVTQIAECNKSTICNTALTMHQDFGVSFFQTTDHYKMADRATKYAIMFILVTFMVFFLIEIIKDMRIHTVQYGLVGGTLAIFYLLLIALSEHMSFGVSYIIATVASSLLLGLYIGSILKNIKIGLILGGVIAGIYAALYVLIGSEDFALLLGTSLIFAVLAMIMILTRNMDWYALESKYQTKPSEDEEA